LARFTDDPVHTALPRLVEMVKALAAEFRTMEKPKKRIRCPKSFIFATTTHLLVFCHKL
jgi:hypothetical protein